MSENPIENFFEVLTNAHEKTLQELPGLEEGGSSHVKGRKSGAPKSADAHPKPAGGAAHH